MGFIIRANEVTKVYGVFTALDKFSCEIKPGITGLLGPNGAGKTTFIRSLLGIIPFEAGTIDFLEWVLPRDLDLAQDRIGYSPEINPKIPKVSAMKFVTHFGRLTGLPSEAAKQRAFDALHYVGLEEARYREMETFSAGMLQRVKLATALVHDPLLLILDEPTAGMDPYGREQMLNLIIDLGKNYGKHIILSTHLLPDVEKTCNNVVVINRGKRVAQGKLEEIKHKFFKKGELIVRVNFAPNKFATLLKEYGMDVNYESGTEIRVMLPNNNKANDTLYKQIFEVAYKNGFQIRYIAPYEVHLDEIFVKLVQ